MSLLNRSSSLMSGFLPRLASIIALTLLLTLGSFVSFTRQAFASGGGAYLRKCSDFDPMSVRK